MNRVNSGFVGQTYIYELSSKKVIVFVYCYVRSSQSVHENKDLWTAFSKKWKKTILISCLFGVHAWLVLTRYATILLWHCVKLNMQIIRDGAHHHAHYLVLTLHVSGISPPRKVLNQRELLSYLQVKVSGQNKRTLVQQAEKKHEWNIFLSLIQEFAVIGNVVRAILNYF